MENDLRNIPQINISEDLDFSKEGIGHWGFIIPDTEKYNNTTYYMPPLKEAPGNKLHHATMLKYMLVKMFKNEKNNYFEEYKNSALMGSNSTYMDSEELSYSSFMSSLGSIVFLNTTDLGFESGMVFVPEKERKTNEKFKEILNFLYEGSDLTSQIIIVPSLEDTLNNKKTLEIYDLEEYKEYLKNEETKQM